MFKNKVFGFIICVFCSLINLPFVLEGGHVWNLLSMIFCAAVAVFRRTQWADLFTSCSLLLLS